MVTSPRAEILPAPLAGENLYIYNRSGTLTINASVVDNNPTYVPGATGNTPVTLVLTVNASANITLAGDNSAYTGGTVVNAGANGTGTVYLGMSAILTTAPYLIPAAGGLTINGATVTESDDWATTLIRPPT
jgi:autotransporter-associated beta strand protein